MDKIACISELLPTFNPVEISKSSLNSKVVLPFVESSCKLQSNLSTLVVEAVRRFAEDSGSCHIKSKQEEQVVVNLRRLRKRLL